MPFGAFQTRIGLRVAVIAAKSKKYLKGLTYPFWQSPNPIQCYKIFCQTLAVLHIGKQFGELVFRD